MAKAEERSGEGSFVEGMRNYYRPLQFVSNLLMPIAVAFSEWAVLEPMPHALYRLYHVSCWKDTASHCMWLAEQ